MKSKKSIWHYEIRSKNNFREQEKIDKKNK